MEELTDTRISVSKELKEHYDKIIERRDAILNDSGSENKDLIGILNATTSIIKELSKIQQELYNSEKFAILQQIIVNVLKDCDQSVADRVVAALEARFEKVS
jgi:hypothetical protein